jgi:hypothetical protein
MQREVKRAKTLEDSRNRKEGLRANGYPNMAEFVP